MADLNYDISVSTKDAISSINGLKTALGGLASAFAIKEVVQFSDGITNLRNKLISITPDVDAVNKQFTALAAIAISSRTPLEAVGSLFVSIQRSAKALGISQQEAAQITDSLSKAMSASGMSAKEMQGPLLQLGQAMQSGVFQGDELRSILEGFPQVAQALADQLGVPVGALKKLGSEGQISADVFVKAMRKAKDSIDEAFGRTTPTITSALEGLKTTAKVAFYEFENNTQTGKNLATAIELLGFTFWKLTKNIDEFAGTITTIVKWGAIILTFTAAGAILRSLVATFAFLGETIFAIGRFFVEFFKGANALGTWAASLNPVLKKLVETVVSLGAAILGSGIHKLFTWFKDAYDSANAFIDKLFGAGDATKKGAEELKAYKEELAKMKQGLDDTAGPSENAAYLAQELAKKLGLVRLEMQQQVNGLERGLKQTQERLVLENEILAANKDRVNISADEAAIMKLMTDMDIERRNTVASLTDQLKKQQQEYANMRVKDSEAGKELKGRIGILQEQITKTGAVYDQHLLGMVKFTRENQNLKLLEEDRKRNLENMIKAIEDQILRSQKLGDIIRGINDQRVQLRFEAGQIGMGGVEKQINAIRENARKAALEAGRSFSAAFEDSGDGLTPEKARELADGLAKITEGYKGIADAQIANLEASRSWEAGWKEAFANYVEDATDAAKQAKTIFDTFTKGFEDAIVRFVQTGKLSFKDLANSIIAEVVRIQAKNMAVSLFGGGSGGGGLLGGIFGGIGNFFSGLFKAQGGPVTANQPYIVGEQGAELFMPRTAGSIVPNNKLAFGGATQQNLTTVNYNIQAVDASSFRQLVARDPQFIYSVTEKGRRSQPTRSR